MASAPSSCARCGADTLIPDARLVDRGDDNARETLLAGVMRHPDAYISKGEELAPVHARVCGTCGFVELYVAAPAALWQAYLERD